MSMGPSLPLQTPQRVAAERGDPGERSMPQGMEQPRGRMLIYWGCGENVRPGQPVIIDFARVAQGQTPPNMVSRRVSIPNAPSPSRARTYGDWPNQQDSKSVPASASLRGDHQIKGNYSPDIQFSLGEGLDIGMDTGSPIDFTYTKPFAFTGRIGKVTVETFPQA